MATRRTGVWRACACVALVAVYGGVRVEGKKAGIMEKLRQEQSNSQEENTTTNVIGSVLAPIGSAEKLKFLQDVFKNKGVDPVETMDAIVKSSAFAKLYDNVEIQHRILESLPHLGALPGFKQARGRRLNDDDTTSAFKEGVESLMGLGKASQETFKDPSISVKTLNDIFRKGDDKTKTTIMKAKEGDEDSINKVRKLLSKELFPGVDLDVLDELHENANVDAILQSPELMHYIDQDKYMSEAFRSGIMFQKPKK